MPTPAGQDPAAPDADALRTLLARVTAAQEAERHALARALHDDIGQQLAAIKLGAMALQDEDDAEARAELAAEIIATAEQTVVALRELSARLRPSPLEALGLEAALRWQAERLFRDGPRLVLALSPLPRRAAPVVELACARIAEEAMGNALRHAQAREVVVSLSHDDDELLLEVADDGTGFAADQIAGTGLLAMRERAMHVGGRVAIDAAPGEGTRVRAWMPLCA
ncbi:MAG TPA: sensor histidine kinase [Xanthomonadaceae bacterium]|nr:sensor histidine kinase [Xanthomonadaceae bacterium]